MPSAAASMAAIPQAGEAFGSQAPRQFDRIVQSQLVDHLPEYGLVFAASNQERLEREIFCF